MAMPQGGMVTTPQSVDVPVEGFAMCVNPSCDLYVKDGYATQKARPITLLRTTVSRRVVGPGALPIDDHTAAYDHPEDDRDLVCPECEGACSFSDSLPPKYPKVHR
jgi:hypothetical protein